MIGKGKLKNIDYQNLPEKYGRVLEIASYCGEPVYLSDDPKTTRIVL